MRLGLSIPAAILRSRKEVTATIPEGPSAFTMTQLKSSRIYQRSTSTGGSQNLGTGSIAVPVGVISAGSLFYRLRLLDGSIVREAAALPGVTTATTSVTVSADARLGWFFVDLSGDGTTWQNGTSPVAMGRLIAISGQSQAVRMIGKMPSYAGTLASLGVAVDGNTSVYARYTDTNRTVTTPAWALPTDGSNYDSTFLAEFLRRQVTTFGVNCGLIGHAVGDTAIAAWQPGTQHNRDLREVLNAAGGFEAYYHHQGGTDAGGGTTSAAFQAGLSGVFGDLAANNPARGANFERYLTTMATRLAGGSGSTGQIQAIRKAGADWAAANNTAYLEPHDVDIVDNVHQGQSGNITFARHLHRATAGVGPGPYLVSGTRAGATITLVASAPLAAIGNVANRVQVYNQGTLAAPLTVSSVAVSGTSIALTLSADPGNAQALDVYWLRHPDPSGTTANSNMLYDRYLADGMGVGRPLQATISAPVAIGPAGQATAPFTDTFTDTAGVGLQSHTPETGQAWNVVAGTMSISSTGTAIAGSAATALAAFDPGGIASYIEGTLIYRVGSNAAAWLLSRASGTNNWYQFGVQPGSSIPGFYIGKTVNGSFSVLGTGSPETFVDGRSYRVRAELNGSTIRLIVDDVERLIVTDTSLTSSGLIGIRTGGGATTATAGAQWDSVKAGLM